MKLTRTIDILPAFDKRSDDPDKNYGIHGCDMRFVLKGDKGAVQFVLYTNWYLPAVREELIARTRTAEECARRFCPLPADVGYHSPVPIYEGQPGTDNCKYLDGKRCYYDGSSLQAEDVYRKLLEGGSDAVWAELEERYRLIFGDQEQECVQS